LSDSPGASRGGVAESEVDALRRRVAELEAKLRAAGIDP
jgi:hypothetical protein